MKAAEGRVTERPHFEKNEPSGTNSTVIALEATDPPKAVGAYPISGNLVKSSDSKSYFSYVLSRIPVIHLLQQK